MLKTMIMLAAVSISTAEESQSKCGYLEVVREYADAVLNHGRDVYGKEHSPLFAEALDRNSMRMLEGDVLDQVASIPREQWGTRDDGQIGGVFLT
jgi:hypothetical protein